MYYKSQQSFSHKARFSPDFLFEGEGVSFFYTYIRKNASTSFKKLFQALYPDACPGDLPAIQCMVEHAQVKGLTPEQIDQQFATKLFVYRDPIDRVFSVYKNKLIQQDGAKDLLKRLEKVVGRDPALLTFDEFVHEYVALLETERWEEVDGHLYPQVWHLLPITYNKVIKIDHVYEGMKDILSKEVCEQVFKEPSNSTSLGANKLGFADSDCPTAFFRNQYIKDKSLPSSLEVISYSTRVLLRSIYAEDYKMIDEIEGVDSFNEKAFDLFEIKKEAGDTSFFSNEWYNKLYVYILENKVRTLVITGASELALVAAKGFRRNGVGSVIVIDHRLQRVKDLLKASRAEYLSPWIDVRLAEFEPWNEYHHCPSNAVKSPCWYSEHFFIGIESIDLLLIDGPRGAASEFARYSALPTLLERLKLGAQVWMDDTIRLEEYDICQRWAEKYGFTLDYYPLEKGVGDP